MSRIPASVRRARAVRRAALVGWSASVLCLVLVLSCLGGAVVLYAFSGSPVCLYVYSGYSSLATYR